ncbi:ABC transporter ATP-binding protein [Nordella sp. HKS 07]|uniref:ABC transporter ATP-binding protein n=1 Tax=Nordella sp. HKS 07 TaxID=2712222 RepID=UPI0013E18056|nr:ABC transporter ATP-binding protein [Nordella sp. HKS 07]QIG48912.1 ABC transporter ATP-binding protein [Nordella sp. HKS 07]
MTTADMALLQLEGVGVRFPVASGWISPRIHVHAVNGVDLELRRGETLGIVGESGCGKSTLGQAIMGLAPVTQGRISFEGHDIAALPREEARAIRRRMQIVFQDPQSSLNPRMPVWRLIAEPLQIQGGLSASALRGRAAELAEAVGLRADQIDRYPHEFSGGQRQRIAIARVLGLEPSLLVLDEPTSALDVSVQAQIVNLLLKLQRDLGLTYLLISHDVALIRHVCDRVAVMYLGQVVETGAAEEVLADPRHPYTRTLLDAVPSLDHPLPHVTAARAAELPSNRRLPTGCFFRERCAFAAAGCDAPQILRPMSDGRAVRCHRAEAIRSTHSMIPSIEQATGS